MSRSCRAPVPSPQPLSPDVVVAGAGFAGLSVACALAARGVRVIVCEREPMAGAHASGHCAGIVRLAERPRAVSRLVQASLRTLRRLPSFHGSGSLCVRRKAIRAETLEQWARAKVRTRVLPAREAAAALPLLDPETFAEALVCPDDGYLDPHDLLLHYLRSARSRGVEILFDRAVERVEVRDDAVCAVSTDRGSIACRVLVNAAGAWARDLGEKACAPLPLAPLARHILLARGPASRGAGWPVVWAPPGCGYFRPEGEGLLLSPGDETPHVPASPSVRWTVLADVERLTQIAPGLAELEVTAAWACLRTFAPDRNPAIGWDPRIRGLFWMAGFGGFGMGASLAAGRLAASIMTASRPTPRALDPGRLLARSASNRSG